MTKTEVQKEIERVESERERLFKEKEPIDQKLTELYNELEDLQDKLAAIKIEEFDPEDIDWDWILCGDTKGMRHYKFQQEFLENFDLRRNGYFPDTDQAGLSISLNKNDPDDTLQGMADTIELFVPHLKPVKDRVRISITDHDLSASYSAYLYFDGSKWGIDYDYPSYKEGTTFNSLIEGLEYIRKYLWLYDEPEDL